MTIETVLAGVRVIPVLEVARIERAAPLATALAAGGLRVIELTLRTACALEALAEMRRAAPSLTIGMGTIRGAADIDRSLEAGAAFLVSPGTSSSLLDALAACGAPSLPGVATVSEAMRASEAGFQFLKFFPAGPAGGADYLRAMAGPLPDLKFCPTGGVTPANAKDYLSLANVACVGGTWIAPKALVEAGDWTAIEATARAASAL